MKRTLPLLTALLLAPLAAVYADDKPNIVFIFANDAGIGDFSTYGCRYGSTPSVVPFKCSATFWIHCFLGKT